MKRNERGVTLIALVVTIIVLLILAGVSIAMLTGDNGILSNAKKAQLSNTEAEAIEKMNVAYNTVQTEVMVKSSTSTSYVPNASTNARSVAELAAKELGVTLEEVATEPALASITTNGYHVYLVTTEGENPTTKIVMLYKDSTFGATSVTATPDAGTYPDANKQYPSIRGEITLTSTGATYTAKPIRSVN